jgi:predicted phosphodiesterase
VLSDISRQGAERVVVNGDMVNRGPNNIAVMERLSAEGFAMTLGNHDDLVRKWVERSADLPASWFRDPFWLGTAWCADQLEHAGWIDMFRELPMTVRVEIEGAPSVLISHGSPRHYREGYGSYLTDEAISEITQMHPADVLVGSHTHRPMERRWSRYMVLNTGAVGTPFNGDPRAHYLLLTLEKGIWQPEFRRIAYDRGPALAAFHEVGYLEGGGISAHIFSEELRLARSLLVPFLMWSEEEGRDQSWSAWGVFKQRFPDRFREPEELVLGNE